MQHPRHELAWRRRLRGYSQEALAVHLGIDRTTLTRWERGITTPQPWVRQPLADALHISTGHLDALLDNDKPLRVPNGQHPASPHENTVPDTGTTPDWKNASTNEIDILLRRLYRRDDEFGGDFLCERVEGYARTVSDVLRTVQGSKQEQRLRRMLASLTHIAGWLAIDAGRHAAAHQHLTDTLHAAHENEDFALASHTLGYMSLHALYRQRHREALSLAQTAVALGDACATTRVRTIVHFRTARAYARLGERGNCEKHMDLAHATYTQGATHEEPLWSEYVDNVELVAQRGACLLDLGETQRATTHLQEAVRLVEDTAPARLRDLAHYKTRLAKAHLEHGAVDQSVAVARETSILASHIGSARIDGRFADLVTRLGEYDLAEARALVEHVRTRIG